MPLQPQHLLLYSAQTWLGYAIAAEYYGDEHYAWCTPYFNGRTKQTLAPGANPPSSTPDKIAKSLREDIALGDLHSAKIEANRVGLRRGAQVKLRASVISPAQSREIGTIIDGSSLGDFRPLVFVIPVATAKELVEDVPVQDKAHPFSEEYIIKNLPRHAFDVIEVP
jgi:hypothetical protein